MAKHLNKIYGFKIKSAARYQAAHIAILRANPIKNSDDWKKGCFQPIKDFVKKEYYLPQNRRCAYCRKKLNTDGYFNPLDHIIPKSHYKRWMFKPQNLAITCVVCNTLKNADDTLTPGHNRTRFPKKKIGFTIFNPHFERWEDCFEIEDGMFIKGKIKKGEDTIKVCKLHQYQYSVQFSEESGVKPKSAIKRAVIRQRSFPVGSLEYKSAKKVVDYYKRLI
jgi:uncharacterized protein (TIGR02646 family)